MKQRTLLIALLLAFVVPVTRLWGQAPPAKSTKFVPFPSTVVRWENGYRYPQAGWIVLHVEGTPYNRGVQHGRLLAEHIVGYLECFALRLNHKSPTESWQQTRTLVNALFLRKFDNEYLEEMKGIADGTGAAGARYDGRAIDIVDIAALNCWSEIESLAEAVVVTPTGLEGRSKKDLLTAQPAPHFERCSAFVATGPATADGKIVFGHVTMYDLYPANYCNIWVDVQPAKGHRFVMSSFPGGIQSSMDYYLNDAGILISETTLAQTSFRIQGMTCASRIRKAIQYSNTIDKAVAHLIHDSNGLYTNEWLLADINTNEIAMLELGTHRHKLWRSSKNEWFGETPGFYWSCNSCKDAEVRLETIASTKARPAKVVHSPSRRDMEWVTLYEKHRGKIGNAFIKDFCASELLTGSTALDVKFTTTTLARELKSWGAFGPPGGDTRHPTADEKKKYPKIKPLTKQDWTLLSTAAPVRHPANVKAAGAEKPGTADDPEPEIVWRGTLLPKSDADLWLALAFADYHDLVAHDRSLPREKTPSAKLTDGLQACRQQYASARKSCDVSLTNIKRSSRSDDWYRLAASKGVLLLHQLRTDMGADVFDKAMDDFGMKHGGRHVTSRQFQEHMQAATGHRLAKFFASWLHEKGLPK